MKIAHVITRFVRGGADENTLLTCNHQAEAGHEVALIHGCETHPDIVAQLHPAVVVIELAALGRAVNPLKDTWALIQMARVLRTLAPEIVHTHTSKAGIIGRAAARLTGVPVIIHGVHILPFLSVGPAARSVYLGVERMLARVTDYFIDVSEGMRAASIEHGVGSEGNHIVIPSGMRVRKFIDAVPLSDDELRRELGLAQPPEALIVSAAVLEPRKRHIEFLEAFAKVVAEAPRTHLAIAGAGPLDGAVRARARELGIEGNVHLLGFRTDVERWMKAAAVCTLASEREGLPRTVIQYVLCGRPVVATSLPGLEALIENGVNGFIVSEPAAMAEPILKILHDEGLRKQMADASSARDLSAWDVRTMVSGIEQVYKHNMARKALVHA